MILRLIIRVTSIYRHNSNGKLIQKGRDVQNHPCNMIDYIKHAVERFQTTIDKRTQSAIIQIPLCYGLKGPQLAPSVVPPLISSERRKRILEIGDVLFYYERESSGPYATNLPSLVNRLTSSRCNRTEHTEAVANNLSLDYAVTWTNASIVYKVSKIQLITSSDASYLTESKGRSRYGYHQFHGDIDDPHNINDHIDSNSLILTRVYILCSIASYDEYCSLFLTVVSSVNTCNTTSNTNRELRT